METYWNCTQTFTCIKMASFLGIKAAGPYSAHAKCDKSSLETLYTVVDVPATISILNSRTIRKCN